MDTTTLENTPTSSKCQDKDGPSSEDIIRRRWAAMGIEATDAAVKAAAREQDDYEARCLEKQPQSQASQEDIDDAWDQYEEEKASNAVKPESKEQAAAFTDWIKDFDTSGFSDENLDDHSEQYEQETETESPGEEDEPTPTPKASQAAAEAVQEAVSHSSERRKLTKECPLYIINRTLANCRVLTSTERCCLGLLNSLMQKHGYAFVSNEQLALWLCMKSPDSVRNMLAKLSKAGFIQDTGRRNLEIRWVVRHDLQNPKRKR